MPPSRADLPERWTSAGWSPATLERGAEEHRELARRPAAVDRDPVLRLGDAAHRWPEYRDAVTIMDVYRLTPGGAGTTPGELRAYLERRGGGGKPLA